MIPNARTPEEHRFLTLCMLLLHDHPRIGASLLSVHRGEALPYVKGWNVIRGQPDQMLTRWVFIDDHSGYTTRRKPEIESSKIHVVDYTPPPLENTTAWMWASNLGRVHGSPDWALKVLASIHDTSDHLAFPHDPDAETAAVASALQALQEQAFSFTDLDALAKYFLAIMRPYLTFEQPGMIAASVLTAVLTNVANFTSIADPVQAQLDLRDTLGDRIIALLHSRIGMRPATFGQMTYLAALYGQTALIHSSLVRSQFTLTPERSTLLAKWDQNVDELLAHEILPHFVYFAMPSVERIFRLGENEWESMSKKYGSIHSSVFDLDTMNFSEYGPCTAQLLQDAVEQLRAYRQ